MKTYNQFVKEHDAMPLGIASGEDQQDPDKPRETQVDSLIAALEEIIEVAKRAMNSNGGLADKSAKQPTGTKPRESENRIARPLSDSPEELFGVDR